MSNPRATKPTHEGDEMTMRKLMMLLPIAAFVAACGDTDDDSGDHADSGHDDHDDHDHEDE